jgi:hypothetical protein
MEAMNRMLPPGWLLAIAGVVGSAQLAAASPWRVEPCKWRDGPFQMEGSLDFPKQEFPKMQPLSEPEQKPEKNLEHEQSEDEHAEHAEHGKGSYKRNRPHGNPMFEHRHERQHIYHQVYKPPKAD